MLLQSGILVFLLIVSASIDASEKPAISTNRTKNSFQWKHTKIKGIIVFQTRIIHSSKNIIITVHVRVNHALTGSFAMARQVGVSVDLDIMITSDATRIRCFLLL